VDSLVPVPVFVEELIKGYRIVLSKPSAKQILLGALIFSVFFVFSCNETKRHEMLTFFFDGVPPLGGEQDGAFRAEITDPNAPSDPNKPPAIVWYEHEARRNCENCHGKRDRKGFSRAVKLVAQVPDLCYQCHPDYQDLRGWVHGPVVVGECLFCHEPHSSRNPSLLKQPVPDLCYRCHEAEVIAFFDSKHADPSYANCTQCHEGHSSENPSLLKKDRQKNSE
jgi:predicted CXXCH cytochrome family protein